MKRIFIISLMAFGSITFITGFLKKDGLAMTIGLILSLGLYLLFRKLLDAK